MSKRTFFQRLFSIEALAGAIAGAMAPYALSLAIEIAPTRVSIGWVVLSVAGGALLGYSIVAAVRSYAQKRRAAQERRDREHQELKTQLQQVESSLAGLNARRRWLGRRSS